MKVFFDNCTPPVLADTLAGFISHFGHSAHHIKDLACGRHAADLVWIEMLASSKEDWVVITGDLRITRNRAERTAFRQAMLKGFVLAPAYQKTAMNQIAAILVWRWPSMETLMSSVAPPALYELPVNRSAGFRQLPL